MWIQRVVKDRIRFLGHYDLKIVSGAYLILFEVGIPNLLCGYMFVLWSVTHCSRVTVTLTLTSGISSREIVSRAYILYYAR